MLLRHTPAQQQTNEREREMDQLGRDNEQKERQATSSRAGSNRHERKDSESGHLYAIYLGMYCSSSKFIRSPFAAVDRHMPYVIVVAVVVFVCSYYYSLIASLTCLLAFDERVGKQQKDGELVAVEKKNKKKKKEEQEYSSA
eukprot:gene8908-6244_t